MAHEPATTEAELAAIRVKTKARWMFYVDGDGHIAMVPVTYDRFEGLKARPTIVARTSIRFEAGYDYFVDADGRVRRSQTFWGFSEADKKQRAEKTKKATPKKAKPKKATPKKAKPRKASARKATPKKAKSKV